MAAYLLTYGVSQLFYGPLSDRVGRRPVILVGMSIFMVATVIAITSLADSPLRRLAHFTLDTVSGETEWRSSSMSTRTAQNSVTDLLFVGLVQLNDVESLKMIQRSSELTQRLK